MNVYELAESAVIFDKTTAMPVTPPKEKLFGNLNTYTPTTKSNVATVKIKYSRITAAFFIVI